MPTHSNQLVMWSILFVGIICAVGMMYGDGLRFDSSADTLLSGDKRSSESYHKLQSAIGEQIIVSIIVEYDNIFSYKGALLINRLSTALANFASIEDVKSLTHSMRPIRKGFSLNISKAITYKPFLPVTRLSPHEWQQLKEKIVKHPLARNIFISGDGRYTNIVVVVKHKLTTHMDRVAFYNKITHIVKQFKNETKNISMFAFPFVEIQIAESLKSDIANFLIAECILIMLVLWIVFKSIRSILLILVYQIGATSCLMLIFKLQQTPVNIYTLLLFPLVGGLQLTFMSHFLTALKNNSLRTALLTVLWPSSIAAITTVAGLLSLSWCDVALIKNFGLTGAFGVMAVFCMTFLPISITAFQLRRQSKFHNAILPQRESFISDRLIELLQKKKFVVCGAALLFIFITAPSICRIHTDVRAIKFLDKNNPSRKCLELLNTEFGGINILQLLVDTGKPGGVHNRAVLNYLESLRIAIERLDGVNSVYDYSQLICLMNYIWENEANGSYHLPTNNLLLMGFNSIMAVKQMPLQNIFIDRNGQKTTMIVRTRDMPAKKYLAIIDKIMHLSKNQRPKGVIVSATQGIHSIMKADRHIVSSQIHSLGGSILLIFGILSLLFVSPQLGALCLIINIPSLACIAMLLGYGGIQLNSVTIMACAIVLGIAVDDSIHFIMFYKNENKRIHNKVGALKSAMLHKLQPMVCTSAILIISLGLLVFSSFPPIVNFAILTSCALAIALLCTILLLPAILMMKKK